MKRKEELRKEIIEKTKEYYRLAFKEAEFEPGISQINYGGRFFDENEMVNLIDSSLDFWLTSGRYTYEFEEKLAKKLDVKSCTLTTSGSSANLLAFMSLTSYLLKDRRIKRGDEVITVAAGFPTTVAPIIQYGAIPVFVDVEIPSYNIDVKMLNDALSEKTKAVMIAHTLGNPFNLSKVKEFCNTHGLWLIEDNCDALGSKYNGQFTGTFGDIATCSFYPPHHITMGEGGALFTNNLILRKIILSMRDWGRDCWCPSGKDNTCKKRFSWNFDNLPKGYDHKYVYSHFGYNLKVTDMQAAIGVAQLDKLDYIVNARRKNHLYLLNALRDLNEYFILPEKEPLSEPSWFGFTLTVRDNAGFCKSDIVSYLENNKIQTRMLFAGNLLNQPCFNELRQAGEGYRVIGDLANTNIIMNNTFWLGVYPGMNESKLNYIVETIRSYIKNVKS